MTAGTRDVPDSRLMTCSRSDADVLKPSDGGTAYLAGGNILARFTPFLQLIV